MSLCIIQLHGIENVEDAELYIECAAELYSAAHEIVFSIQSKLSVYEELISRWSVKEVAIYLGEQRRTLEEWLLYYAFSGYQPEVVYDAVAGAEIGLSNRFDAELCYRLKSEFEKCINLTSMSAGVIAPLETASALVETISNRAEKVSFILKERLDSICALMKAESLLARGLVNFTIHKISSFGQLDCGSVNMFESVLNEYRVLEKKGGFKEKFIDDRKNLLLALSRSNAAAHDDLALVKYLLVQSAYGFSLSKLYLGVESNLAALFAFRSFEFLVLSFLIESGSVVPVFYGQTLSYKLNGRNVLGLKDIWVAFSAKVALTETTLKSLSSFITVRNKSYLGHGFFHSSDDVVNTVLKCLMEIVNSGLNSSSRDYWLEYKRCSRGLKVKDGFEGDLFTLSV
ncbi:hypothetical protein [Pseudomonas urmiensis]|uniref:hypothetical protein n=1 Tax=Pseudomonas urmiensis TaxID=2745493 RepID=UPI0034D6C5F5